MIILILIGCWLLVVLLLLALARAAAIGDRLLEDAPRLRLVPPVGDEQDAPPATGDRRVAL